MIKGDKKIVKKPQIELLNKLKFIYGSFSLDYKLNKNNEYKKEAKYITGWKKQTESFYDTKYNGLYILTGKISNIFVIDIDDELKCSKLKELCDLSCNLICKTKKGYHYYYQYDEQLNQTNQYEKDGFDIRSDGGLIYAPPTYYKDENNNIIRYKYIMEPNDNINYIDSSTKELLLGLISNYKSANKNTYKSKQKIVEKKIDNIDDFDNDYIKQLLKGKKKYKPLLKEALKDIIDNLDYLKHDSYIDWIKIGMCLKSFGNYGLLLWHSISSKSSKYNYEEVEKMYNSFNDINEIGIGSLLFWLKNDNIQFLKI